MSQGTLPPGQKWIDKIIEYAALGIPKVDPSAWRLKVHGEVFNPVELKLDDLERMTNVELVDDFHCVEGWSVRGVRWRGVPLQRMIDLARPKPSSTHVLFKCLDGYSSVASSEDIRKHPCLLATKMNGEPLTPEAGFPLRLVISGLYAWKYAKWISEVVFLDHYEPGYWESRGYHPRGDVWKEERYR